LHKTNLNAIVKYHAKIHKIKPSPYSHNRMVATLAEAIDEMAKMQLGKELTKKQIKSIETFLRSLDAKKIDIKLPVLPASTKNTPKPDVN